MSTPKINFFIQAVHRGIFTGPCPGPGRPVNKQLFGLSALQLPGTGFRRGAGDAAGEDPGSSRVCPAGNDPEPEQLFPIPRWQEVPIPKAGAAPISSCTPSFLRVQ